MAVASLKNEKDQRLERQEMEESSQAQAGGARKVNVLQRENDPESRRKRK